MIGDKEEPGSASEAVPSSVPMGRTTNVDLSGLPEELRTTLLKEYVGGMLDINRRANELAVDGDALKQTLRLLSESTKAAAAEGVSATITHTQKSTIGRTEIIIGNTDQARSGKLTKSQTGERDWTPYYVIGGLIATVLIAAAVAQ